MSVHLDRRFGPAAQLPHGTEEPRKNNILLHRTIFLSLSSEMVVCFRRGRKISREVFLMTDMTAIQDQMKAIATAHTDYAKSSFEANKSYLEQLATLKAPDQAMQLMTDHMKI